MFYVLDFFDHTFVPCEYPEQVKAAIEQKYPTGSKEADFVEDYIEIIFRPFLDVSDPDLYYTHDEFMKYWMN